jgi:hypothetical protein
MRNFLLLVVLISCFIKVEAQVQRKTLVESFSNASCAPCAAQNPTFNNLLIPNKDKVITLKFQMSWPGFDPMNIDNPTDPEARRAYYNINAIPYTRIDGVLPGLSYGGGIGNWNANNAGAPSGYNQAVLDYATSLETFVEIEISHEFQEDGSALVSVKVTNTGDMDIPGSNLRLMLALTENEINFPAPPGSTNERTFYSVMRKMIPDVFGTPLTLEAGVLNSFDFEVEMPIYLYDLRQIAFVAFVQNLETKEVFQSEISTPIALENVSDVAVIAKTEKPSDYCDMRYLPKFEIINPNDELITSVEINYTTPSGAYALLWEGELEKNQKVEVYGEELEAQIGSNLVEYRVVSVNEQRDYNRMNNLLPPDIIRTLSPDVQGVDAMIDFEDTPNFEEAPHTVIDKRSELHMAVLDKTELDVVRSIGAYGMSEKALLGNCYDMLANVSASLVIQGIDMTELVNYALKFDYAYASYTGESDRLIVEVSSNCGNTWTTVFNRAGSALATAPNSQPFYVPLASQWKSETISLSGHDGTESLMVRFRVVSAWGNNIWLDNISVQGEPSSIKPVLLDEKSVQIYPNPVQHEINLILNFTESSLSDIYLYNINGKLVDNLSRGEMIPAGVSNKTLYINQAPGVYFLTVRTQIGEITKRVIVIK